MKRFRVEWLILVVGFAVAIMGLVQLFHEEAYAVGACNAQNCPDDPLCMEVRCVCNGQIYTCGSNPCATFCIQ